MTVADTQPVEPDKANRRAAIAGGITLLPLTILFALNFVEQFDRVAFAALVPEIQKAFHLSDAGILAVGGISGVMTLLSALPLGVLSDRVVRVRLAVIAAVLWSAMSLATGVVGTLWLLYIVRIGSGIGQITNEVVHPSLLQDYYPRERHPKVFGLHRLAVPLGAAAGPVAGYISASTHHDYRWAFILLALPTWLVLFFAVAKLKEPLRGESIDKELAASIAETEGFIPFGEARRQLFGVATLKRLWTGAFFLGVGALQIANILSKYFEKVFGMGPTGRGFVQFAFGLGTAVGLLIGSRLASQATASGKLNRLAVITGLSFVQFGIGLILLGAAPWEALAVFFAFFLSIGVGAYQPAYFSLVGLVAPPRVRSQAYAWAILIYGCGGLAYVVFLAGIGEHHTYRAVVILLAVIVAVAGAIGASAQRFVNRDAEQAQSTLATAIRIRDEMQNATDRPLLVCKAVEVAYGSVQILFGVDIEVREGEIIALLGTNGAGKSTLLKAISGLVDPIGGAIFFDGRDITHADAVQAARSGIVQVPGGKAVFPTLTVAEHFRAGTWLYADEPDSEINARVEKVLDMFPRLRERWDQMAGNMSGGEQQQLALGMAFVAKPRLLVIDELSLGLAPTIVEQLLNIVREIHAAGCTIILVEQSINVALTIADRAYFMEKGEVRFEGPTAELLERGDILRSVFLEGAAKATGKGSSPVPAAVAGSGRSETPDDRGPILAVEGLSVRFGGIQAVSDVTFHLDHGQILGLIGPNGAGKTTIFDMISGLLVPTSGRLWLKGEDMSDWGPDKRAAFGLGRSFQDARIFPSLTVAENIAIGLERHIDTRDHLAALLNLPAIQESEEDVAWTVDDLIELMGLTAFRDKFVAELSTGSRRIVDLAMSIAHDPSVLLLDEPSSGVAQRETEALGPLLQRIQRETGCSMLLIEHDMPLITSISDEILALELGQVVLQDVPEKVISDPRVVEAYLGGDLSVINRSGDSAKTDDGEDESGAGNGAHRARRSRTAQAEV